MRRERGFTLVELMGSLGLVAAVAAVAGALTLDASRVTRLAADYESEDSGCDE